MTWPESISAYDRKVLELFQDFLRTRQELRAVVLEHGPEDPQVKPLRMRLQALLEEMEKPE